MLENKINKNVAKIKRNEYVGKTKQELSSDCCLLVCKMRKHFWWANSQRAAPEWGKKTASNTVDTEPKY